MAYNVGDYILNETKIASGPNTYQWLRFDEATRNGKNVTIKLYIKSNLQHSSSYRADAQSINLWIWYNKLNDDGSIVWTNETIFNGVHKPQDSGSDRSSTGWPKDRTVTKTISTAGSSAIINMNVWDSTGAADYDWYMGEQTINLPPGAPILANSGSPAVLCNKATWTVYDTLNFNVTEYKVYDNGTQIQHVQNVNNSSFNVNITGLSPGTYYGGYTVTALANGVWSNAITLTPITTTSLPSCWIYHDTNNGNIYLGWPTAWRSTVNPRLSLVSGTIYIPNRNKTFEVDNYSTVAFTDQTYSYILIHTLDVNDRNAIANANKNSNSVNISSTWMRTVDGGFYDQSGSFDVNISNYKPIFSTSNVTAVVDTLTYIVNNITNNNTIFIKGINIPKVTFNKMDPNYSDPSKYNITNYGDYTISGTESNSHEVTMTSPLVTSTFDITAYNLRGNTKISKSIDMIEYSKPSIINLSAVRTNGVDTTADIIVNGTYTKWRSGLKVNNSFPTIQYSINGGTSWSSLALSPTYNDDGTWSASMRLPGTYSLDNSYPVKIRLLDQVGKVLSDNNSTLFYGWTESNISTIPTGKVMLWKDLLRKWLGIGKKPTCALDVVGDIKTDGKISLGKTSWTYNNAAINGSKMIDNGSTIQTVINELRFTNGQMGSFSLGEAYTKNNITIPVAWYNYLYIPHRTGGMNGSDNGDNCKWGQLILYGMTISNSVTYKIRLDGQGDIAELTSSLLDPYPVGSVYITFNSTSPATLFGGTWSRIGVGRTLVSAGGGVNPIGDTNTNSWGSYTGIGKEQWFGAGELGGETGHALSVNEIPAHTHTGTTSTNGAHTHTYGAWKPKRAQDGSKWPTADNDGDYTTSSNGDHNHTFTTDSTGSGYEHNNVQPYIAVYMWRRTA